MRSVLNDSFWPLADPQLCGGIVVSYRSAQDTVLVISVQHLYRSAGV